MGTKKRILQGAVCACATLVAVGAIAAEPAGVRTCIEVRRFHDGDTFTCVTEAGPLRIRVAGIDAPEVGQDYWRVSRDLLRTTTQAGAKVGCYKVDRYERQICRVSGQDGQDVALGLVEAGLAWHTRKYIEEQTLEERDRYAEAESTARERDLGFWSLPEPQEPSVCRELKKQRQKCK